VGHLVGADFGITLTAEENNLISLLDLSYIGNVDRSQIHAHSAYDRRAPAAHNRLRTV
jgi:hypothetical protein